MKNTESQRPHEPEKLPDRAAAWSAKKRLLWLILFVVLAAATIWAVILQNRNFSLSLFVFYLSRSSNGWMIAAVACMLGFIFFEAEAVRVICRSFGYRTTHKSSFVYSAADIYVSAITPSATGGQPACAYFMMKDGIPGVISTITLLMNLTMYTVSIVVLGLVTFLFNSKALALFDTPSQILIGLGFLVQIGLIVTFVLLLKKRALLHNICRKVLHALAKIRLIRHETEKLEKLEKSMREYETYSEMIVGHRKCLAKTLALNLCQRACIIAIPLFVYLASGGAAAKIGDVWAVECAVVIGATFIPIPGAMGVSDYLMLDGFGKLMPYQTAVNFELLSRALSFYVCILLCGLTVLLKSLLMRKQEKSV